MQKASLTLDESKYNAKMNQVFSAGFSGNSTILSYQGSMIYAVGNNIVIDNSNKQILLRSHDNVVTTMAISPKRKLIVSGQVGSPGVKNYESPVLVWSISDGKLITNLSGLKEGVKKLLVSDDQRFVVGCSNTNQIIIWSLDNFKEVWVKIFENSINLLKLQTDGLIFTHAKNLHQANLVPLIQANKPPQIINYTLPSTGLPRTYCSFCQVAQDKILLGTEGGEICFFDKTIFKWMENAGKGRVSSIVLCDNRSAILAIVDQQVIKFQLKEKNLVQAKKILLSNAQQLVECGNNIYYVQCKGAIYELNASDFGIKLLKFSHRSRVMSVDCNAGLIASIEKLGLTIVRKWSNDTAQVVGYHQNNKQTQGRVVVIREDGKILNGYSDGCIRCIDQKGTVQWEFSAHKNAVTSIFSSAYYLLTGGQDAVVRIWANNNNKLVNQISAHQKTVSKVLGDKKMQNFIHSCSIDKSVHTYDMKTDKKVNFRSLSNGAIMDMAQADDGNLITVGVGMPICIWDLKSYQPIASIQSGLIKTVSLAVSEELAAVGTDSGLIALFDLKKLNVIYWWQASSRQITSLKWISKGIICSGADDNTISVWRI